MLIDGGFVGLLAATFAPLLIKAPPSIMGGAGSLVSRAWHGIKGDTISHSPQLFHLLPHAYMMRLRWQRRCLMAPSGCWRSRSSTTSTLRPHQWPPPFGSGTWWGWTCYGPCWPAPLLLVLSCPCHRRPWWGPHCGLWPIMCSLPWCSHSEHCPHHPRRQQKAGSDDKTMHRHYCQRWARWAAYPAPPSCAISGWSAYAAHSGKPSERPWKQRRVTLGRGPCATTSHSDRPSFLVQRTSCSVTWIMSPRLPMLCCIDVFSK